MDCILSLKTQELLHGLCMVKNQFLILKLFAFKPGSFAIMFYLISMRRLVVFFLGVYRIVMGNAEMYSKQPLKITYIHN